jgi:hypothetical protein
MTHPTPGGAGLRIAAAMPSSTPVSQRHLDRNILRYGVAARRHRLAEIETSMVEACERAAVRAATSEWTTARHGTRRLGSATPPAAARLEPDYLPQMHRLLRDIDRFERLLTLPIAAEPAA